MLKYLYLILAALSITVSAKAGPGDTVITYHKNYSGLFTKQVSTVDSADFIRMIYPDSASKLYNIAEYYTDGKTKFMGKLDKWGRQKTLSLEGYAISFYPDGKKRSVADYVNGSKVGLEYIYNNNNGHLFYVKKWATTGSNYTNEYYWDFYDNKGTKICENGNGKWLYYDSDFKHVRFSGDIKNGFMDGTWTGYYVLGDTIKYASTYNKDVFISGVGYDKNGAAYPYKQLSEHANYSKGNLVYFVMDLQRHLVIPRDSSGKKMNIDTVHVSFVVEKDGSVTQVQTIGTPNPQLTKALVTAADQCGKWTPSRYYGVPYRTWFITSLKISVEHGFNSITKRVDVKGNPIADPTPDPNLGPPN